MGKKSKNQLRKHAGDKKLKQLNKKDGKGIQTKGQPHGRSSYKPTGKYKKELQIIGDVLFGIGFEYTSDKSNTQHHKFKHKSCRFCQTSFGSTISDRRTVKAIVTTIKKVCQTQCQPPIALEKIPAELFTLRMAGLSENEQEYTLLDVLDEITQSVTLSAQIRREKRDDLRRIADQKGITLGELIEEMMEVYEKNQ